MKAPSSKSCGFSLVEVVVALGLFAFCVVAIVGLLGVGLGATRSVANETAAVNIAESIYGAWQAQDNGDQPLTVTNLFTNLPPLTQASSQTLYFNGDGVQTSSDAQAAFEVEYNVVPAAGAAANQPVFSTLRLGFKWPKGAPTNSAQMRSYSRLFVKNP